jgi:hypothetical protein
MCYKAMGACPRNAYRHMPTSQRLSRHQGRECDTLTPRSLIRQLTPNPHLVRASG